MVFAGNQEVQKTICVFLVLPEPTQQPIDKVDDMNDLKLLRRSSSRALVDTVGDGPVR